MSQTNHGFFPIFRITQESRHYFSGWFPGICSTVLPRVTAKAFAGTRSVAQEPGKEDRRKLLVDAVRRAAPSVLMACFIRSIMYAAAQHIQPLTKFASSYQFSKPKETNFLPDFTCAYHPPQE
jgi:hypothetical protein